MSQEAPSLYTIAAGVPFVDALALGLIARHGGDPLGLSRVTVLLPNRRAGRALREAFLRVSGGRPLLLPQMQPLGDIDEEELTLSAESGLELPPAVTALRRQLLLTRLVLRRPDIGEPAQAARFAAELARLLDQVQIERLDIAGLAGLVPAEFAAHWQITLEFLSLVTAHWPAILAAEGAIDPAVRRNLLLAAQAERWRARPPADPIYAAGSTGSIPAAADLLAVVSRLPAGAVILPGFDRDMDAASLKALDADPSHPQYGMNQLLRHLGATPEMVAPWPAAGFSPANPARVALWREALRPAATADAWVGVRVPPSALDGMSLLEAPGAREEAAAIALLLRQALETPGRTAALVTADRALARRVAVELGRFGVTIDSSAGRPLGETPPGTLLRLTADLIANAAAPVPLLAALKHPLAAGTMSRDEFRRQVRRLERRILRGPRPAPGMAGLAAALRAAGEEDGLAAWLQPLEAAAEPFARLMEGALAEPAALLEAHVGFTEWLATDALAGPRLWAGEAGSAAADFIHELAEGLRDAPPIAPTGWPALMQALMEERVVRESYGAHPRLAIWGPLEARLQQADLLILGGLNEGSWPPDPGSDPWMSRPMRARFGLPAPERRIGQSAHDFQQATAARDIVLSRAVKLEGAPTVASRWLLRLATLLDGGGAGQGMAMAALKLKSVLAGAAALDRPDAVAPLPPPMPCPPVASRPRRLSVTEIETWIRDPYAIYARRVLRLEPLEPLDADPGAAERGSFIHAALDGFVRNFPDELPAAVAAAHLQELGRVAFGDALRRPEVRAFWWPRFLRIIDWFLDFERERRAAGIRPLATECRGSLALLAPGGPFELVAKADRIDRLADGTLAILDYKTGQVPSAKQVKSALAPQLPLEAAIAKAGGFASVPAGLVSALDYIRLSGGATAGAVRPVGQDAMALAEAALDGLGRLIETYDLPATPYRSRLRPKLLRHSGAYDHLARVKEWSAGEDEDASGEEEAS